MRGATTTSVSLVSLKRGTPEPDPLITAGAGRVALVLLVELVPLVALVALVALVLTDVF